MTDVFIRYAPQNRLRYLLSEAVLERWYMEPVELHVLAQSGYFSSPRHAQQGELPSHIHPPEYLNAEGRFWTAAKQYAEDNAKSEIYVVADDDQLIIGKDWVKRGVEILEVHPEFGLLSAWSVNGEVQETADGDEQIFTIQSSVGCPYFMRKGAIKKFPESEGNQQDTAMCEALWQKGWKYGFIRGLRFNHLGYEYSTIAPGHWGA